MVIRPGRKRDESASRQRNGYLALLLRSRSATYARLGQVLQATADLLRKNSHLDEEAFTELLAKRGTARINGEAEVIRTQLGMRKATAVEFYLVREYNNLKGVDKIRHA